MTPVTRSRAKSSTGVRIGPLSVLTAIVVLSLSVLAVLCVASAHASLAMSARQAESVQQAYANERAAQAFYASLDAGLAGDADVDLRSAVESARAAARACAEVDVATSLDGSLVHAEFSSEGGRTLTVELLADDGGIASVEAWKHAAYINEEQPMGKLWAGL